MRAIRLLYMPRVLVLDRRAPDPIDIHEAARVLRGGGLVAFPTETVYGLGARALDPKAIARVFAAKGRPTHHPLIAHVLGETQAGALAASWPDVASRLARAFWPGPLTLVVDRAPHVPAAISGGGTSIAVRCPDHVVALSIIALLREPIAAPSANRYQGLSPTAASHVVKQLGDAVDLVLDGGPCGTGIESTVVDVRGAHPQVLRPGAVAMAALRDVVPDLQTCVERANADQGRASPGMGDRHYAPRARLVLADTWDDAQSIALGLASTGARVGLVACETRKRRVREGRVLLRSLPRDPPLYAQRLYGTLHDLDDAGVEAIVVQRVPQDESWWAVADRLSRAASM
jgi:L-threonylcarbamoyladenylate synthase